MFVPHHAVEAGPAVRQLNDVSDWIPAVNVYIGALFDVPLDDWAPPGIDDYRAHCDAFDRGLAQLRRWATGSFRRFTALLHVNGDRILAMQRSVEAGRELSKFDRDLAHTTLAQLIEALASANSDIDAATRTLAAFLANVTSDMAALRVAWPELRGRLTTMRDAEPFRSVNPGHFDFFERRILALGTLVQTVADRRGQEAVASLGALTGALADSERKSRAMNAELRAADRATFESMLKGMDVEIASSQWRQLQDYADRAGLFDTDRMVAAS